MNLLRFYYLAKPAIPARIRWAIRRAYAKKVRQSTRDGWPIKKGAEVPPKGWPGWPGGKKFAVVLTHDVECQTGYDRVRDLAEIEIKYGFRSSFNFVPERDYKVTEELRNWLVENGFEVGVHGLKHDGKLYNSRAEFERRARKINHYLDEWNAIGFRSPLMHRNLDWLHQLDITYDLSTFDTDPFEPQPDGYTTIFPFFVTKGENGNRSGYWELPYTLPQDSTLFLLLREDTPAIWKNKLDWVAANRGMALVNVHPDYIQYEGQSPSWDTYPIRFYEEFLAHLKAEHEGQYWHVLPKEIPKHMNSSITRDMPKRAKPRSNGSKNGSTVSTNTKNPIWIDLDNTPHVPFFEPIIEELEKRGYPVLVTARDAFQVCQLAEEKGLPFRRVGKHWGKNRVMKALGLGFRTLQLLPVFLRERPVLGVSHGARSQLLLSNMLRRPTLCLEDYEHSADLKILEPTWLMAPDAFASVYENRNGNTRLYPGIKEDVYAWRLDPDEALLTELGLDPDNVIATVRPPATEAHYHNPESEKFFIRFMERASAERNVQMVLLPRNRRQLDDLKERFPHWFTPGKTIVPDKAVDGMNLIWYSDFVVSGGGTMNREAAALDVPVYSIFRGEIGAVDRRLSSTGRLTLIEKIEDVEDIRIEKRSRSSSNNRSRETLDAVVDAITEYADQSSQ